MRFVVKRYQIPRVIGKGNQQMKNLLIFIGIFVMTGCASALPPLKTVDNVDLSRFMGSWYVVAAIPTFIETKAYNAIEEYRLLDDGSINTTFIFNKGGFEGPVKRYNPRGFVIDKENNSTWGMRFIWPFQAEYLITYLNDDYSQTIIGRNKRDYFWIMSRSPEIAETDYQYMLSMLKEQGYDINKVRKVPQSWGN